MLELRDYQRAALDNLYEYFRINKEGNPLVVIPTAGGKSLIIAAFCREILGWYPGTRIINVTHVRELVRQNHDEILEYWPEAPTGIYSAGLDRREHDAQVLFCGIQSVYDKVAHISVADIIMVDEVHLTPRRSQSMYGKFFADMAKLNPNIRIVGVTATPYRLDSGMLHEGKDALFDKIVYEISILDLVPQYLSPLVSKRTKTVLNVTGVGTRAGDFIQNQLEKAVNIESITKSAVQEVMDYGHDRGSWLLFCSGVSHALCVADELNQHDILCETIFGHTKKDERDDIIDRFKKQEIRAIAAMNVLTTGFNAKMVDLIALLRPTQSPGLYVQMVGRGTRQFPGKKDCLVLDFAGNIGRHGKVEDVRGRKPGEKEEDAKPPHKTCPECSSILHAAFLECPDCGFEFPVPEPKIEPTASTKNIMGGEDVFETIDVTGVEYYRHLKEGKPDSMRVEYYSGYFLAAKEWVCLDHDGFAKNKAFAWWKERDIKQQDIPDINQALKIAYDELKKPTKITVKTSGKFPEIAGFEFEENEPVDVPLPVIEIIKEEFFDDDIPF